MKTASAELAAGDGLGRASAAPQIDPMLAPFHASTALQIGSMLGPFHAPTAPSDRPYAWAVPCPLLLQTAEARASAGSSPAVPYLQRFMLKNAVLRQAHSPVYCTFMQVGMLKSAAQCQVFHVSRFSLTNVCINRIVEVAISVVGQRLFHNERFRVRVLLEFGGKEVGRRG